MGVSVSGLEVLRGIYLGFGQIFFGGVHEENIPFLQQIFTGFSMDTIVYQISTARF